MSLSPGSRVGPYEVLSPLGAGGMGEVYRARDPRLGRGGGMLDQPLRLAHRQALGSHLFRELHLRHLLRAGSAAELGRRRAAKDSF